MSQANDIAAGVKTAISSANATRTTTAALQSLLGSHLTAPAAKAITGPGRLKQDIQSNGPKDALGPARTPPKAAEKQPVAVYEDKAQHFSKRERYALATEIASLGLRTLSQAVSKTRASAGPVSGSQTPKPSRHVLSESSANVTPSPKKSKSGAGRSGGIEVDEESTNALQNVAECVAVALAYLCSSGTADAGHKKLPDLQIESAMVATAGKMVALGFRSLAIQELHLLRQQLEKVKSPVTTRRVKGKTIPKQTLASLLEIGTDSTQQSDLSSIVITHQLLSLQLIVSSRDVAAKEAAFRCFSLQNEHSPAHLIYAKARQSPGQLKACVKQLQALSTRLLDLSPGISSNDDSAVTDTTKWPSPITCFQIFVLSLEIRKLWWELAGHSPKVDQEIVEPFRKALIALQRRSHASLDTSSIYSIAKLTYDRLGLSNVASSRSSLHLHTILSTMAGKTSAADDTRLWNDRITQDAERYGGSSALKAMAKLRHVSKVLPDRKSRHAVSELALEVETALGVELSGNRPDYDMLLGGVAMFVQEILQSNWRNDFTRAFALCAEFAQKYHRSYPDHNPDVVRGIVLAALLQVPDNAVHWIKAETISILSSSGVLAEMAERVDQVSWDAVWSSSKIMVALDQAILALLQRHLSMAVKDQLLLDYGSAGLAQLHQLLILERLLGSCVDFMGNIKYHEQLTRLIPYLVRKVLHIHESNQYPFRRTRIEIMIFLLQEVCPSLQDEMKTSCPDNILAPLQKCPTRFSSDFEATWTVSRAFAEGKPTDIQLTTSITAWHGMLTRCQTREDLETAIYDTKMLHRLLHCCSSYLAASGENTFRLKTLQCISMLLKLASWSVDDRIKTLLERARVHLKLLQSEVAGEELAMAQKLADCNEPSMLARLQLHLGHAEYYIAIDRLDKARIALQSAERARSILDPRALSRPDRAACQRQHAQAWMLQSMLLYREGAPHDAIQAGRRSFRLLNSEWSAQEQRQNKNADEAPPSEDPSSFETESLTNGVSKLQLKPEKPARTTRDGLASGSAFWVLVPLLSDVLLHVSTLFTHHGSFTEADWYSRRALRIAEDADASNFAVQAYVHRVTLLCLAGQVEDAELCVEKAKQHDPDQDTLLTLSITLAQAEVRNAGGSSQEAVTLYERSQKLVSRLQNAIEANEPASGNSSTASIGQNTTSSARSKMGKQCGPLAVAQSSRKLRKPAAPSAQKFRAIPTKAVAKKGGTAETAMAPTRSLMLEDLKTEILLRELLAATRHSPVDEAPIQRFQARSQSIRQALHFRHVSFRNFMRTALTTLSSDFTLNVLPESTLSLPGVLYAGEKSLPNGTSQNKAQTHSRRKGPTKGKSIAKVADTSMTAASDEFHTALLNAEDCLLTGLASSVQRCPTATTYLETSMLAQATTYRAVIAWSTGGKQVNPCGQALYNELPRIKASQDGAAICALDSMTEKSGSAWQWPELPDVIQHSAISTDQFQSDYIDILPQPWTALSLTMNDDCTELFVVRYRRDLTPFILRLPLSRHDEEQENDAFDYTKVKEEFQEIVTQSNFSCHNAGDVAAKGARSRWWNERQALDHRLQDLLVNMENLWFGGFRGIFNGLRMASDALGRFAKQVEAILGEHLPSRRAEKGSNPRYRLDQQVLELFTGLAKDEETCYDVDEAILDLLYFVVDMLQFSGERNAYDEIDFDRMTVAVADALRTFHDDNCVDVEQDQHLVLILEKRLQYLPWENLPSLESRSVSRVGSMQTLRECILAAQLSSTARKSVDSTSGTYILNPSGDLVGTREMLEPALLKMPGDADDEWTSIVNRAPDESEFSEALSSSKILLYFGHGAGSQYIRPRAVKKMERCSEVVWLMGCSSGAVTEYGQLEPSAVPLTYLQAGNGGQDRCLSIVATLWDVTDKDIDRFSLATGERWGLWPATETAKLAAKTPQKRRVDREPRTPERAPKTPKTPKVYKTPVPLTTPNTSRARSRNRQPNDGKMSLTEAVAESREACYLRYLNGAAPVVYGIPVYLK